MAKKQIDLGLTGLDELFMDDRERAESKLPKIHEIPLSEIDEFPRQYRFRNASVNHDAAMAGGGYRKDTRA